MPLVFKGLSFLSSGNLRTVVIMIPHTTNTMFGQCRYSSVVTRQRALCLILLCWMGSVLSAFGQFIGSDLFPSWNRFRDGATTGLEWDGNWTSSVPPTSSAPNYHDDREVIAEYLPYGGFLSKFFVEDRYNFTYAQIHGTHWFICAPNTILSPQFLVYAHGTIVFVLPFLCLLAVYLDLFRLKPKKTPFGTPAPKKHDSYPVRHLVLSLSLLVLLCLPIQIIDALCLFSPTMNIPSLGHAITSVLFQLYGLVPQILFTPTSKEARGDQRSLTHAALPHLPPAVPLPIGISVHKVLCEAVQVTQWSSAKHSLKAKVCPQAWVNDKMEDLLVVVVLLCYCAGIRHQFQAAKSFFWKFGLMICTHEDNKKMYNIWYSVLSVLWTINMQFACLLLAFN